MHKYIFFTFHKNRRGVCWWAKEYLTTIKQKNSIQGDGERMQKQDKTIFNKATNFEKKLKHN